MTPIRTSRLLQGLGFFCLLGGGLLWAANHDSPLALLGIAIIAFGIVDFFVSIPYWVREGGF